MQKYSIEEARRIVMNCAKQYDHNLNGKDYIILYKNRNSNKIEFIETRFRKENYQHLTGIEMIDSSGQIRRNVSTLFYHKCIKNTLRKDEIVLKTDGTTQLKLQALPVLMDIHKITKIAADYQANRTYLVADKIIGNVNFCLGLKAYEDNVYVPNSALLENIKKITTNQSQVLAIFSKEKDESHYKTIRYIAKGVEFATLNLPKEIMIKLAGG